MEEIYNFFYDYIYNIDEKKSVVETFSLYWDELDVCIIEINMLSTPTPTCKAFS